MKLSHVSASQVKTFARCPRKWHYEKVLGKRSPGSKATRRGTAIHHALEVYAKSKRIIDIVYVNEETGRVTDKVSDEAWEVRRFVEEVKHLIDEDEIIGIETDIRLKTFEGGPDWIGFVDLLQAGSVNDYKTTSSLRYAKTPGELLEDPQACSYVLSVFRDFPEADEFPVRFIYIHTANKIKVNVRCVTALYTREQCESVFSDSVELVKQMVKYAEETDVDKVPGNSEACFDFGGCPHRAYCSMKPEGMLQKKPKHEPKPNPFTHPELFKKKKKEVIDNPSFHPPEIKDE